MPKSIIVVAALSFAAPAFAEPLEYYLDMGAEYDPSVPRPEQVIRHELGEWHLSHDRLVQYMRALADASDRVQLQVIGRTHEDRPLLLLAISSPANLARLDEIRERHLALSDPRADAPSLDGMPAVVWMGYSVHGNEPSGANAAPAVAYHLAAAQDDWTRGVLDDTVILFDPAVNPDGLQRFSTWANSHRGQVLVADRQHREHQEGWPSGRTNHYWFDLNRDWLLLVHPESQARIAEYQRWRPNVLTDHHEMGTDRTFFFQPGVPTRQNPLFPQRTFELTARIAEYHAAALDEAGSLYFSKENYDDFYLGKGSTYPDIQGSIGILFEQASSRGHLQESVHGEVTFPFTIRNQVLTSFSTLRAVQDLRPDLLRWQRDFYAQALAEGRDDAARGWVFGDDGDPERAARLVALLDAHRVEVHPLAREVTVDGTTFRPGQAWVVPTAQPQYRLARGLFERRTEFEDNTFYDVSSWTLPLAFGLPHAELGRRFNARLLGDAAPRPAWTPLPPVDEVAAYAFDWSGYFAPRAAYRLLDAGVAVRTTTAAFGELGPGSAVVPVAAQDEATRARLVELLDEARREDGIVVHALRSGLSTRGVDLGSPSLEPMPRPRVAILVGRGADAYEAGEAWHLLDRRFGMPVTLLELDDMPRSDLTRYSHLVLVDGRYDDLEAEAITAWVEAGGVLVASKRGARWAAEHRLVEVEFTETVGEAIGRRDYADARGDADAQLLRGAIFAADLDTTHPLGWGIARRDLAVFRDWAGAMQPPANRYATVARYTESPQLAGYASARNRDALAGTASVVALRKGRGVVVLSADNLNFRGFWYGTNRVFMNALFFSHLIRH